MSRSRSLGTDTLYSAIARRNICCSGPASEKLFLASCSDSRQKLMMSAVVGTWVCSLTRASQRWTMQKSWSGVMYAHE